MLQNEQECWFVLAKELAPDVPELVQHQPGTPPNQADILNCAINTTSSQANQAIASGYNPNNIEGSEVNKPQSMNADWDLKLTLKFLRQGSKSGAILYRSSEADRLIAASSPTVSGKMLEEGASQQDVSVCIQKNNSTIDRTLTLTISGGRHADIKLDWAIQRKPYTAGWTRPGPMRGCIPGAERIS